MLRALVLVLLYAAACAAPAANRDIYLYQGGDRAARLIAGAKQEGQVVLYSTMTVQDGRALAAAFERKYGVKLIHWRGSAEKIVQRALAESKSGHDGADVFETSSHRMEALRREQLLEDFYTSAFSELSPAAFAPDHRQYVAARFAFFVLGYNTRLVKPAELPARYEDLLERKPLSLAALLNITTAMREIHLPERSPLDYLRQLKWDDSLAQDRFFAYCDPKLIDQVRIAAEQHQFAPETNSAFFHPGATASWKQIQFGEANVQLTFHESDKQVIDGLSCILVEPDIDYYKDLGAHALLEVVPNALTGGLTNPEAVYVLRWIAGRHAGVAEFDPPYTLVS